MNEGQLPNSRTRYGNVASVGDCPQSRSRACLRSTPKPPQRPLPLSLVGHRQRHLELPLARADVDRPNPLPSHDLAVRTIEPFGHVSELIGPTLAVKQPPEAVRLKKAGMAAPTAHLHALVEARCLENARGHAQAVTIEGHGQLSNPELSVLEH